MGGRGGLRGESRRRRTLTRVIVLSFVGWLTQALLFVSLPAAAFVSTGGSIDTNEGRMMAELYCSILYLLLLFVYLIGWLINDWLINDWLIDWLIDRVVDCLAHWWSPSERSSTDTHINAFTHAHASRIRPHTRHSTPYAHASFMRAYTWLIDWPIGWLPPSLVFTQWTRFYRHTY